MKNLFLLVFLFVNFNIAACQQVERSQEQLQGEMELIIDVSKMKDTSGKFMIMVGGEILYPSIKNNMLTLNYVMKEPRRTLIAFFPDQKLKDNPGKRLNEIAIELSDYFYFLGVPGKSKIVVNGYIANSELPQSSEQQKKYISLLKLKQNFDTKITKEKATLLLEVKNAKENKTRDSLLSIYYKYYQDQFSKYYKDTILSFVRFNPDSPASLIELEEYSDSRNKDLKLLTFLYNNLTDRMKALPTAKRIYGVVDAESFANNDLIGKLAPNFTQSDPFGKPVSLSDFKGHVTLLEFWASWCGPCRQSNPALVKTYQKFNKKGFKIIGVSLDNNKENWLKAIKDDNLSWTHTSDLKLFNNSVAVLYHINAVPSNFLIDSTGKIIASDLNDKQLDEQLEKLLQK